ncbi:Cell wall mannoprotein PIR1 [Candida viswanathii]|uniref:Cell wall mannoprotein PIR1 n=1 Tax=Candida viswanathii TaxID=5486 RepID=A0A367XSJ6_9ASCO|nr:Cell wall mannoprotein PIR1 [Candida viswanathii]
MKFSTATLTFSLFAIANAGIAKPKYYKPAPKPVVDCGLETVDYEFALGVKEKCDGDVIYLAFEVDDGQLEHNGQTVDCECAATEKRGYTPVTPLYTCTIEKEECVDTFTLCDGILKDECERIGEIVANHQFQFDNPIQPDALYTCGWSIVNGDDYLLLALNGCTDFWECPVDDCGTYKLYDASIDCKCKEVEIVIILIKEECPPEPCEPTPEPCEPTPEPCEPTPEPVTEPCEPAPAPYKGGHKGKW